MEEEFYPKGLSGNDEILITDHNDCCDDARTLVESEALYKCGECGKEFKTKMWFDKHSSSHDSIKNIICDLCGTSFKRNSSLNAHYRQVHSETKRYCCKECSYQTNNQTNYKTHFNIKHLGSRESSHKCNSCDKSYFRKEDLMRHKIKMHNASRIKCDLCSKTFTSQQYLRIHQVTHNSDFKLEHQCCRCGKMFPNNGCLSSHIRKKHLGLVFTCEKCGKVVSSRTSLRDHMTQHSGEKSYNCFCGKQFATRKYLQVHAQTHTGARPYACKLCDGTFTQKSSLTVHLQRYHVDVKPYKCTTCSKEFVSASLLKTHLKTHKSALV